MPDHNAAVNVRFVRVRMHHTDLVGGVYHGTFFSLFDEARTEMFRDLGYTWSDVVEGAGRLMVIVHVACDYKRPARMDDLLAIHIRIATLGKARLGFSYHVSLAETGETVAMGEQVFAFLAQHTGRPTSVPPRLVALARTTPGLLVADGEPSMVEGPNDERKK